jgi:hypothetical protein
MAGNKGTADVANNSANEIAIFTVTNRFKIIARVS